MTSINKNKLHIELLNFHKNLYIDVCVEWNWENKINDIFIFFMNNDNYEYKLNPIHTNYGFNNKY